MKTEKKKTFKLNKYQISNLQKVYSIKGKSVGNYLSDENDGCSR
jgi:hypothetical protein